MITLTTWRRRKVFLTDAAYSIIERALAFHASEDNVIIAGYVIAPDHVHILARPALWDLPPFIKNFKTYTGGKIKLAEDFTGGVWRRRFFTAPADTPDEFAKRLRRMHNHPVKDGIVETPEDYLWSSAAAYSGKEPRIPLYIDPWGRKH